MPERVPCFEFKTECDKLVKLLDILPTRETKEEKNNLIVTTLNSVHLEILNDELNQMTTFQLECLHCVMNWLLHLIYFECSIYHDKLIDIANSVSKLLNVCAIGGSSNTSFMYNWQHIHLQPNSFYDARTLNNDNILPRFKILSNEESESLWYFIKGHILMEARACNIFDGIMKLYTINENGSLILFRETLSSICDDMKSILTVMALYMHKNKVLLEHWPTIQQLLKLPTFDGIRGLQNCWIFALNFICNVKPASDEDIQKIEESVWQHLLPLQMKWMLKFKQNSQYLMVLCKKLEDNELFSLYQKLVNHVITWRAIHRSRASQFIESSLTATYMSTGSGQSRVLTEIQSQLDRRIKDFSRLQSTIRMTTFVHNISHHTHQHPYDRTIKHNSRRISIQHTKRNFKHESNRKGKSVTFMRAEWSIPEETFSQQPRSSYHIA